MKKSTKRILSLLLVAAMSVVMVFSSFAADAIDVTQPTDIQLQFNEDGKFRIIQFADCQDIALHSPLMVNFIEKTLEVYKPDLVVFTGDNVVQPLAPLNKMAIEAIIDPVAKAGIPFTFTFGNHDAESISKERMYQVYRSYPNCIAYDADPDLSGMGTCNHAILSSDGSRIAFNIWIFDSNMYEYSTGKREYDFVHEDQIEWYKRTSEALEAQAGYKVPSLAFQHIPVPEIYELYLEAQPGDSPTKEYNGKTYALKLNPEMATGYLGEFSCPPVVNSGQFDAFVERGDLLGIAFGHDHINSFVGTYKGIDLIQTAGVSMHSYGDDAVRGARLFVLDENGTYETEAFTYNDLFTEAEFIALKMAQVPAYLVQFAKVFLYLLQYIFSIYPGIKL